MGFFGDSAREKEEAQFFNKMEERIARIIARGKDPRAYDDVVIYLLYKEDKKKNCKEEEKKALIPYPAYFFFAEPALSFLDIVLYNCKANSVYEHFFAFGAVC